MLREADLEVKIYKAYQVQSIFGSWDVENRDAIVARANFQVTSVKKLAGSDHFWKLRRWKSARRCGVKAEEHKARQPRNTFASSDTEKVHAAVARSTFRRQECKKTNGFRALLAVDIFKKCAPLWREAYFDVKSVENSRYRITLGR